MSVFDSIHFYLASTWAFITAGILMAALSSFVFKQLTCMSFVRKLVMYGKYQLLDESESEQTSKPLSMLINTVNFLILKLEIPKSSFRHFYFFSFFVNCFVLMLIINIAGSGNQVWTLSTIFLLLAQLIQSIRRIYETNFVSIYSGLSFIVFLVSLIRIYFI